MININLFFFASLFNGKFSNIVFPLVVNDDKIAVKRGDYELLNGGTNYSQFLKPISMVTMTSMHIQPTVPICPGRLYLNSTFTVEGISENHLFDITVVRKPFFQC